MTNSQRYLVHTSKKFRKDVRRLKPSRRNLQKLQDVVDILLADERLPQHYHNHSLKGEYSGYEECHIEPDWLLIYRKEKDRLVLVLTRTGSHSDLFDL